MTHLHGCATENRKEGHLENLGPTPFLGATCEPRLILCGVIHLFYLFFGPAWGGGCGAEGKWAQPESVSVALPESSPGSATAVNPKDVASGSRGVGGPPRPQRAARFLLPSPSLHHENLILRKDLKKSALSLRGLCTWLCVSPRQCVLTQARNFQAQERRSGIRKPQGGLWQLPPVLL